MKRVSCLRYVFGLVLAGSASAGGILINHEDTDITVWSTQQILDAKEKLHIGYGHTSHGSQITSGMSGLVTFANNGGLGLSHPTDIFAWNHGGSSGALDLEEGDGYGSGWLDHDCGYYPTWVNETRTYLNDSSHSDVNVIMWSWCGQVDDKYKAGTLYSEYLTPMSQLEADYPDVRFVYMTGHVDHWDDTANKAANNIIRAYCDANDKVLYDFADIEMYDPDGTYFEYPHDNCDYYSSTSGVKLGNWATEWQNSHTEGVDWYSCYSAHSQPLNANQKAYAAWALFISLAEDMVPHIDGDCDLDGDIDANDLASLGLNWCPGCTDKTWAQGDFNGDGDVDSVDLAQLGLNWNPAGLSVPEPLSAGLLLTGGLGLGLRKKRPTA